MDQRAGPLELPPGCRVRHYDEHIGTVESWDPKAESYYVKWDDFCYSSLYALHYAREALTRVCKNCELPREDHAHEGKCLYAPTSWK